MNKVRVVIFDTEGNNILDDELPSVFVGLQAGETFWYGDEENRSWAKVAKITYGIDTSSKCFYVEMVVTPAVIKETKSFKRETKMINHGENLIIGSSGGGMWIIKEGDIVVTVGAVNSNEIRRLTLQVNSPHGGQINSKEDVEPGDYVEVETEDRKVICTLVRVDWMGGGKTTIGVIERIYTS